MKFISIFLVVILFCFSCTPIQSSSSISEIDTEFSNLELESSKAEQSSKPEGIKQMQIITDLFFEKGINLLSQKDHSNGDRVTTLGKHSFYDDNLEILPNWCLAQWDSGPCLIANRVKSDRTKITDGIGRTFAYNPELNTMTFELDTSLYYNGKPAIQGDYWPHLLVEQTNFINHTLEEDRNFLFCDAEHMVLSMDIRLTDYSITPIEGDWVNAAQFLMYFYVNGVTSHDFCWFGVSLFDNRYEASDHHIAYDGGKPDASGAMIYLIGSKYVYENSERSLYSNGVPDTSGEWVHIEIDLKPYLEDMFEKGRADGYFKSNSLSQLFLNGMNVGWESIGTFDHTMEIRNLELNSYDVE